MCHQGHLGDGLGQLFRCRWLNLDDERSRPGRGLAGQSRWRMFRCKSLTLDCRGSQPGRGLTSWKGRWLIRRSSLALDGGRSRSGEELAGWGMRQLLPYRSWSLGCRPGEDLANWGIRRHRSEDLAGRRVRRRCISRQANHLHWSGIGLHNVVVLTRSSGLTSDPSGWRAPVVSW